MARFLAPGNEVKRRAVFRNITQHRHDSRFSLMVKRFTPADDLTGCKIKAALVPSAFDDALVVDAGRRMRRGGGRGRRLEERQLQMRTGIVESKDLFALPEHYRIEAGKFEHLRL